MWVDIEKLEYQVTFKQKIYTQNLVKKVMQFFVFIYFVRILPNFCDNKALVEEIDPLPWHPQHPSTHRPHRSTPPLYSTLSVMNRRKMTILIRCMFPFLKLLFILGNLASLVILQTNKKECQLSFYVYNKA